LPTVPIAAKSHKLGAGRRVIKEILISLFSPRRRLEISTEIQVAKKLCFVVTGHNFSRATPSIFVRAIFIFLGGPQAH
jgi:hypothetical protein